MPNDDTYPPVIFYYRPITNESGRIVLELNRARLDYTPDPSARFPENAEYILPTRERVDLNTALALRDHGLFYEYLLQNRGKRFTGAQLIEIGLKVDIPVYTVMTFMNSFVPRGVIDMPSAMAPFAVGFSDNNVLLEFRKDVRSL